MYKNWMYAMYDACTFHYHILHIQIYRNTRSNAHDRRTTFQQHHHITATGSAGHAGFFLSFSRPAQHRSRRSPSWYLPRAAAARQQQQRPPPAESLFSLLIADRRERSRVCRSFPGCQRVTARHQQRFTTLRHTHRWRGRRRAAGIDFP